MSKIPLKKKKPKDVSKVGVKRSGKGTRARQSSKAITSGTMINKGSKVRKKAEPKKPTITKKPRGGKKLPVRGKDSASSHLSYKRKKK